VIVFSTSDFESQLESEEVSSILDKITSSIVLSEAQEQIIEEKELEDENTNLDEYRAEYLDKLGETKIF
jgi:hypothetical protein